MKEPYETLFINTIRTVEKGTACHLKYVQVLLASYRKNPADFKVEFMKFIHLLLNHPNGHSNTNYVYKFFTYFCAEVTKEEQDEDDMHPFFTLIFSEISKYFQSADVDVRTNVVNFVYWVLKKLDTTVTLESDLCKSIETCMLQRMRDPRINIKLQAIETLSCLQSPCDADCPIINELSLAVMDNRAKVRKEVVAVLAPCQSTLGLIKDRLRDINVDVRKKAVERCGDIGPVHFRIVERISILKCWFSDESAAVQQHYLTYLLPKWLLAYQGNYRKLISSIILMEDEDFEEMTQVVKLVIEQLYRHHPIQDIVDTLPVNAEKVIDLDELTNDVALFWSTLVSLMRQSDDMGCYVEKILPELTRFSLYIESIIVEVSKAELNDWQQLEYEYNILNLLEIAESYDYSDESGRRSIYSFAHSTLTKHHFNAKIVNKLVCIAQKASSTIDSFTQEMCVTISTIKDSSVTTPLTADEQRNLAFKIANLKVRMNEFTEEQEEAVKARDFQRAEILQGELLRCRNEIEGLHVKEHRVPQNETQTLIRCLDILIAMLKHKDVVALTPSLVTCKDSFLVPSLTNTNVEVHWRLLNCLTLYSVIDKSCAEEYGKILSVPMATYRTVSNHDAAALCQSIAATTDLIALYGDKIICVEEDVESTVVNSTTRKLYDPTNSSDSSSIVTHITKSSVLETLVLMLDDENEKIQHCVINPLSTLLVRWPINAAIIAKIFLKWYSPAIKKSDSELRVQLGFLIERYLKVPNSKAVLKSVVIPIITSIANAPGTSPLRDIDMDNVLRFFCTILRSCDPKDIDNCRMLILDVCEKISDNPTDRTNLYLIKVFQYIELPNYNIELITELINRCEMLLEIFEKKMTQRIIVKFVNNLKKRQTFLLDQNRESLREPNRTDTLVNDASNLLDNMQIVEDSNSESPQNSDKSVLSAVENVDRKEKNRRKKARKTVEALEISVQAARTRRSSRLELLNSTENNNSRVSGLNESRKSLQVKRKKQRGNSTFMSQTDDDTVLHTIIETSMEIESMDDTVATCNTSKSSENQLTVISETSDSDTKSVNRKSTRIRKKKKNQKNN